MILIIYSMQSNKSIKLNRKKGGILLTDSDLVDLGSIKDVRSYAIPSTRFAEEYPKLSKACLNSFSSFSGFLCSSVPINSRFTISLSIIAGILGIIGAIMVVSTTKSGSKSGEKQLSAGN